MDTIGPNPPPDEIQDLHAPVLGRMVPFAYSALRDGKDEMNFAEFPLGVISKRTEPANKTLVFEDQINDQESGKIIKRKLTVSGSDAFGLPTSTDEDVLLALIQISKLQGFRDRKVYFTRYQVIRMLGWPMNGQTYDRVEQALNRWVGVTLYYDNSWRFDRRWANEKFHVIESISLDGAEQPDNRAKSSGDQAAFEFASSWFIWNQTVFDSFQSGNLKSLDFASVMALDSAISRRLYRFLDKRFYQRKKLEFDLRGLAYEHIGFSRATLIHEVKRQLTLAIVELEATGFLRKMDKTERFLKQRVGEWRVVFEKQILPKSGEFLNEESQALTNSTEAAVPALSPLEQRLVDAGVRLDRARELVNKFPAALIEEKIEALAYLVKKQATQVSLNPAGFLIRSIEEMFENPKGFESSGARQAKVHTKDALREKSKDDDQRQREALIAKQQEEDLAVATYWASLSDAARKRHEAEALAAPNQYEQSALLSGGDQAEYIRSVMLAGYAHRMLAIAAKPKAKPTPK